MRIPWKTVLRVAFALILTTLGVLFFVQNRGEVWDAALAFKEADPRYLLLAAFFTGAVSVTQALVLQYAYRSIEKYIPFKEALALYFKRFFLSAFIPGGFTVAQYTMTRDLKHHDITPSEHAFASSAFVTASVGSYLALLVPSLIFAAKTLLANSYQAQAAVLVIAGLVGLVGALAVLFRKAIARFVRKLIRPHVGHFHSKPLVQATAISLIIDSCGVLVLACSIRAVGASLAIELVAACYFLTAIVLSLSPFFQGLVVVESALVFFLTRSGLSTEHAIASTLISRGFLLWILLLVGGVVHAFPIWRKARTSLSL